MRKQVFSIALVALCLCAVFLPDAHAATPDTAQPYYTGTTLVTANIGAASGDRVNCEGSVKLKSGYEADLLMELQKETDGGWSTIKSWSTSGSGTIRLSKTYFIVSGNTYRVLVSGTVRDSNGHYVETASTASVGLDM